MFSQSKSSNGVTARRQIRHCSGSHRHGPLRFLLVAWLAFIPGMLAFAQDPGAEPAYEVWPVAPEYFIPELTGNETPAERVQMKADSKAARDLQSSHKSKTLAALKSGSAARDTSFDNYINNYELAAMAQTTNATISQVGSLRQKFLKDFVSASSGANRTYLIESLIIPAARKMATGNYHPSVRLNAVYLAGQLDEREGDSIRNIFPIPHRAAAAFLTELVGDENTPGYLVAAAMAGMVRVAEIEGMESHGLDVNSIRSYSQSVLAGNAPGQGNWDPELDYWIRKRSIQSLGFLQDVNSVGALSRIAADDTARMMLRMEAAQALSRIKFDSIPSDVAGNSAMALTRLTHDVLAGESTAIRNSIEELVAINMLWSDIWLIDPAYKTPAELRGERTGRTGSAMGPGGAAPGSAPGSTGGDGMSAGGGDGDGRDSGGQGQSGGDEKSGPTMKSWREFDLPNYQLNIVRRRSKAFLFGCQRALNAINKSPISGDEKKAVTTTLAVIDSAMKNSDIGLVDLGRPETGEPETDEESSATIRIMEAFAERALEIGKLLPQPAEPAQPAAPAETGATETTAAGPTENGGS